MTWGRIHFNSSVSKHDLGALSPTHQIQAMPSLQLPWATGRSPYTYTNYRRLARGPSNSTASAHSKRPSERTISYQCNFNSHGHPGTPPSQRQPRQPVERRILRRHESRARYSELLKVCIEVVRVPGMNVTTFTDPRRKCISGDQTCPAPTAQISTSAQPLWSCHIST